MLRLWPDCSIKRHSSPAAHGALAAVAGIRVAGATAHAVQADLADPGAARRLFDQAESQLGPLDILVNNAGVVAGGANPRTTQGVFGGRLAGKLKRPVVVVPGGPRRPRE